MVCLSRGLGLTMVRRPESRYQLANRVHPVGARGRSAKLGAVGNELPECLAVNRTAKWRSRRAFFRSLNDTQHNVVRLD